MRGLCLIDAIRYDLLTFAKTYSEQTTPPRTIEILRDNLEIKIGKHPLTGVVVADLLNAVPIAVPLSTHTRSTASSMRSGDDEMLPDASPIRSPGFSRFAEWEDIIKYLDR